MPTTPKPLGAETAVSAAGCQSHQGNAHAHTHTGPGALACAATHVFCFMGKA